MLNFMALYWPQGGCCYQMKPWKSWEEGCAKRGVRHWNAESGKWAKYHLPPLISYRQLMLAQNTIHQKSRWKKQKTLLIFVEIVKENQTPIGLLLLGYQYKSVTRFLLCILIPQLLRFWKITQYKSVTRGVLCILIPQLLRFWKIKSEIIHVDI